MSPRPDPLRLEVHALSQWMHRLFIACGISSDQAAKTSHLLMRTSLRGIDTHGISRVPSYVQKILAGEVSAKDPVLHRVDGALHVDGRGALGQVAASKAIEAVIQETEERASAHCLISDCGHLSALSVYVLSAAERGRVAFICQGTPPIMGMAGSSGASIGNNPLAFAAPMQGDVPLVFDMASSVVARGRILQAQRDGRSLSDDWALDADGQPTTDAASALNGFLRPMADHKGMGLALMVEVLTAGLSGWRGPSVVSQTAANSGSAAGVNAFLLVLNPDRLCGQTVFEAGLQDWMKRYLAISGAGARYPGERQAACERERQVSGIPVPVSVLQELRVASDSVGCAFDALVESRSF